MWMVVDSWFVRPLLVVSPNCTVFGVTSLTVVFNFYCN